MCTGWWFRSSRNHHKPPQNTSILMTSSYLQSIKLYHRYIGAHQTVLIAHATYATHSCLSTAVEVNPLAGFWPSGQADWTLGQQPSWTQPKQRYNYNTELIGVPHGSPMAHLISPDSFNLTPASLLPFPPWWRAPCPSSRPSRRDLASNERTAAGPGKSKDKAEMMPLRPADGEAMAAGAMGCQSRTRFLLVDVLPMTVKVQKNVLSRLGHERCMFKSNVNHFGKKIQHDSTCFQHV